MKATMLLVSIVLLAFLLLEPGFGETSEKRQKNDQDKSEFEKEFPLLNGTEAEDFFHENVVYQLHTNDGNVLRVTFKQDSGDPDWASYALLNIGTSYLDDKSQDTGHFVFIRLDNEPGPGLAAIFKNDITPGPGYFRLLQEYKNGWLATHTRTACNPDVCYKSFHYPCPDPKYLPVYPQRGSVCTNPAQFFFDFKSENGEMRRLNFKEDDKLAYLSPVDSSSEAVSFHIRPVINRAVSVVQNITYLTSPADIVAQARDVTLGISELITNHGDVTFVHEISHSIKKGHEATVENYATLSAGFSITHEVGVSADVPGVASASVTASVGFSFDMTGTKTSAETHGTEETLKMTQRITVGPGTRLQCSAFFKVVPHTTIEFEGISKVYIYWQVYDKTSNQIVPKLAPLSVAMVEVARNVKGWEIIGTDGDAVIVKFRGAITAEHGIATVFSSEPI